MKITFYLRPEDRRPAVGIAAIALGTPVVVLAAADRWVIGLICALVWLALCATYALSGPRAPEHQGRPDRPRGEL